MKNSSFTLFTLGVFGLVIACGSGGGQGAKTAELGASGMKEAQYQVAGEKIYTRYCAQCHQAGGEGLASLYPPLKNSDYLMQDLKRAACIISNGAMNEIIVNGKAYNQAMPANPQLSPLEVAEVLTYISNSWGNDAGISNVKEVEKWLNECEEY